MPYFVHHKVKATMLSVVLSVPLLFSGGPSAHADDRDAARIIAGAVALGLVAKTLSNSDRHPHADAHPEAWRSDRPFRGRGVIKRGCGHYDPDVDYVRGYGRHGCPVGRGPGGYWDEPPKPHGYWHDYRRQTGHPSVISPNH